MCLCPGGLPKLSPNWHFEKSRNTHFFGQKLGSLFSWPGKHRMDFHFSPSSVMLPQTTKSLHKPESKTGHAALPLFGSVPSSTYWIVGWGLRCVISGETTHSKDTCVAATVMSKHLMKTHKDDNVISSIILSFLVKKKEEEELWSIRFSWSL